MTETLLYQRQALVRIVELAVALACFTQATWAELSSRPARSTLLPRRPTKLTAVSGRPTLSKTYIEAWPS